MQVIKIDLPADLAEVEIHTLADLHIGDKHCDMGLVQQRIQYVADTPNAYAILNGDLLNNATKTSISDIYEEQATPIEQVRMAARLIEPIKDKILAMQTGNHELRSHKKEGIDLMRLLAMQMRLEDRFSPGASLIFLRVGQASTRNHSRKLCYTIFCNHGSGGGRKEGAKAVRLADMACIVDADVYVHAHTHLPMIFKQAFYRTSPSTNSTAKITRLFVNSAAALDYGGYGEQQEYKPSATDTPVIYLSGTQRRMEARL